MALFKRFRKQSASGEAAERLGRDLVAVRRKAGQLAPAQCVTVLYGESGHSRRMVSFRADDAPVKVACMKGEQAWCFHPGPYTVDLVPFAAAPEVGLRMTFVVDAADPRVTQQRFDLFLVSEADAEAAELPLAVFAAAAQSALRGALEQGTLDLPPCTSLDEWNQFRAGLNELMYTRFGVTVEDCLPVDLADSVDFAALLRARAAAQPPGQQPYAGIRTASMAPQDALPAPSAAEPRSAAAPTAPTAPVLPQDAYKRDASAAAQAGASAESAASPRTSAAAIAPTPDRLASPPVHNASEAPAAPSTMATSGGHAGSGVPILPANPAPPGSAGAATPADSPAPTRSADVAFAAFTPASATVPADASAAVHTPSADEAAAAAIGASGAPYADAARVNGPAFDKGIPSGWTDAPNSRTAQRDAAAIRRLFLELPALSAELRQIALPEGQQTFREQQSILQRLALLALDASTMPSLDWTTPEQKAQKAHRSERAEASRRAAVALDEAWTLLAALKQPNAPTVWLQDADRVVANLEYHLARRRSSEPGGEQPRVEPKL